jgi:hypothetical protein
MSNAKRPQPSQEELTEDMEARVEDWFWYGFESATEIDAAIDADAAAGEGFDISKVKAFAVTMLAKKRAAEAQWPQTTDCDKLDRAFARLHEQGICALQCAGDTMDDGIEAVREVLMDESIPEDRYHGYCFYYSQDIDSVLDEEELLLVFGHVDRSEAKEKDHIAVGQTICEALRQAGLTVDWDGSPKRRIGVPQLRWQRRTPG